MEKEFPNYPGVKSDRGGGSVHPSLQGLVCGDSRSLPRWEREDHPLEPTGPTREQLAAEPVPAGCRRGQEVLPRSSFPAHGPVPGPKHPTALQDVPCGTCPPKGS